MSLSLRRRKRGLREVSATNSFANSMVTWRKDILGMKIEALNQYPAWRQILRLCTLRLVGLAVAVFLWGFGSELSLYRQHRDASSRLSFAKMRIEARSASVAIASGFMVKCPLVDNSQALHVPIQQFLHLDCPAVCIDPVYTSGVTSFAFLVPARSPPSRRSQLA